LVVDNTGVEQRGQFLRADDQDLVMLVDGDERRFTRDTIARIDRQGDSLRTPPSADVIRPEGE
jgi:hypothetical protein